jgi:serine/threonine protein kinase
MTMQTLGAGDPERIGPYVLTGRLGAGGMGSVFLGWDASGRPAAVKVVRSDFLQDPDFRARFRREISSARRVSGPWISRVLDADPDAESPWLATEYVAGPTLDAAVNRFGPLPTETVAVLAQCLGQALEAVHAAGVVHRDIKPNNILLAADGPRLIDFGIARATDDTKLTATHAGVLGVAGFIAPERIERQVMLPAGDVFAGGVVLAYAATGRLAFGGGEPVTVAYRVVHGEPDLDDLPEELRPLVAQCLAKDPEQRPDAVRLAAEAARLRGASDWPGVPMTSDWSGASTTGDTLELATTWLPEPLALHTVRDYDLSAAYAAAETARLLPEYDPRFASPINVSGPQGPSGASSRDGFGPGTPAMPPRDHTEPLPTKRRNPAMIIGFAVAAVVLIAAGVLAASGGHSSGTTPQSAAAQGATQSTSGKDGGDLSAGQSQKPGDALSSDGIPTAGSSGPQAPGSSSAAAQAPNQSQAQGSQGSSAAPSTAAAPPSHATGSHPTSAAPPPSNPAPPPTTSQAPAPAPVPCGGTVSTPEGTGYNCTFDQGGSGSQVLNSNGTVSGYIHPGTNWVICQAQGKTVTLGQYFNDWWAWTESDHGGWGWVNAVDAHGGDNNGPYGGVPMCNGAHGAPPA